LPSQGALSIPINRGPEDRRDYGPTATEITRQALIAPFPVIVWGADELARWARRRHHSQTRIAAVATT
jgi:hypothetical protein